MDTLVSVIICSYNAGAYLRTSVLSILSQTYRNLEVFLVDDGSTDGSVATIMDVTDQRLRVIRQPNRGKPIGLNAALAQARGEFYAIHDADDISDPARIERQLGCLTACPEAAAAFCGHDVLLRDGRIAPRLRGKTSEQCAHDIAAFRMPAHDPTAMYRMSMVRDMQYEPSLRIGQGYDYVLRVGERFPMLVLGECLYSYRIHEGSITKSDPVRRDQFVRDVLRRACERRGLDMARVFPARPKSNSGAVNDNNLAAHFIESTIDLRSAGRRVEAIRTAIRCAGLQPLRLHYYKAMLYATSPRWLVHMVRGDGCGNS